jgi:hypothetical protein
MTEGLPVIMTFPPAHFSQRNRDDCSAHPRPGVKYGVNALLFVFGNADARRALSLTSKKFGNRRGRSYTRE